MPRPVSAHPIKHLAGTAQVPGDKSISHRALMFAALAVGESRISGLLEGADVQATAAALAAMGASITRAPGAAADGGTLWRVHGRGVGALLEPDRVLDMGNSGTSARLLAGILATCPFTSFMTGDSSLVKRPMRRITEPLGLFGAAFVTRSHARLPMAVQGAERPIPATYELPVASAQVKSAVLLAGLNAPGTTTVHEPAPTRDHTETMLQHFGAEVAVSGLSVSVTGEASLRPADVAVPADPSAAAFPVVAALLAEAGGVAVPGVAQSERRDGLYRSLIEMGARLTFRNQRRDGGEPVADIHAAPSRLQAIRVPAERAPSMIDEYPILAVAAALAEGTTVMAGIGELRVKESDRVQVVADGLAACGVAVESGPDWLAVTGTGGAPPPGGAHVATALDHRIAMSFLVLGGACEAPVTVDDGDVVATSFPGFEALMAGLGAALAPGTV